MEQLYEKDVIDAKRSIYNFSIKLCNELIEKAKQFQQTEKEQSDRQIQECSVEICAGSKFLHRGYYCPGRLEELWIDNVKRGRIIANPTAKTKISYRYYYRDDQMIAADKHYDTVQSYEREYLIYDQNKIYGITFDQSNCITGLSAEIYRQDQMTSYLYAACYIDTENNIDLGINEIRFEHYIYHSEKLCDGYIFYMIPSIDPQDDYHIDRMIDNKYSLCYDNTIHRWIETKTEDGSVS